MSIETETEGRGLVAFVAGYAGALGALADHVTASAVAPQLSDTLDELVRALRRDVEALHQGLKTNGLPSDPWAMSLPKILAEVTATHHAFAAVLATAELSWWTRRLGELNRGEQVDREPVVDEEVDHGAD